MPEPLLGENWTVAIGAAAGLATAGATIALVVVTVILARATKNMADRSSQPQVVAAIEPNQWAINHADIMVANTGNAAAFDVRIAFDPPLPSFRDRKISPFKSISVLLPGQSMRSHVDVVAKLAESYEVEISWRREPGNSSSEHLKYALNINELKNIAFLGQANPIVQIATETKKIREEIHRVFSGHKRLSVDTYSAADREKEARELEEWFESVDLENQSTRDGN